MFHDQKQVHVAGGRLGRDEGPEHDDASQLSRGQRQWGALPTHGLAVARTVSRIAGPRWNVNGDWSPSLDEIQGHPRAAHGIDPGALGIEGLLTLHDYDHNRGGYHAGHGHKSANESQSKGYASF